MKRNRSMIIAFALPGTLVFLVTLIYPIIRTVIMSFFSIQEITDSVDKWKFNGIGNYISLMRNSLYQASWINLAKIFLIGDLPPSGSYIKKRHTRKRLLPGSYLPSQCNQRRGYGDHVDPVHIQSVLRIYDKVFLRTASGLCGPDPVAQR